MGKRRYINLVIAPEDRSGALTLRFRLSHIYAGAVAASVAFVLIVGLVVNQAMDEAKLGELELLRRHNNRLRSQVERVAAVEKQITDLEIIEDKLMVIAGEREAARELAPVSVEAGTAGAAARPASISEGWRQFRRLSAARRGIKLAAPDGVPVANGWVTRGFGEDAGLEGGTFHNGVDIAAPANTPVTATAPGVVIFAGDDPIYGKLVIVQHALTGYSTFYGHNSRLKVRVGQRVARGDVLAFVGTTGKSSAPHLHYEVRLHGIPVNPAKYMTPAPTAIVEPTPVIEEVPTAEEKPKSPAKPAAREKEGEIPTAEKPAGAPSP